MYLKRISIREFKTIQRLDIDFAEGLNVVFGLNETGKSTFLEALSAAFFVNADSGSADILKYRPWQSDADPYVYVVFSANGKEYHLEKTFIGARRGSLRCAATGLNTSNKDRIKEELAKLLPLGVVNEQAHKRTFWIAQRELEDTIHALQGDSDIRSALKSAMMKTDGNIESIKTDIEARRKLIGVGWGRPALRPGPLESSKREAERLESETRDLRKRLNSLDADIKRHHGLTVQVAALENEVTQDEAVLAAVEKYKQTRKVKEADDAALGAIQEEIESYQKDQDRAVHLEQVISGLVDRQGVLDNLLAQVQSVQEVTRLTSELQKEESLLQAVSALDEKVDLLRKKQAVEDVVRKADVEKARLLDGVIVTKQAELRAAQLSVEAKGLSDSQLRIGEDTSSERTEPIRKGEIRDFRANERMSLTIPNVVQLVITSGGTSAATLHGELQEAERSFNDLLTRYAVVSVAQLAERYEVQQKRQSELDALQNERRGALRQRTTEDIRNSVASLKNHMQEKTALPQGNQTVESADDLRRQRDHVVSDLATARAEARQTEANTRKFSERYGSLEKAQQKRKELAREASKAEAALEETPTMELPDDQVFLKKQRLGTNKDTLEKMRADLLKLSGALQAATVSSDIVHLKEAELEEAKAGYQANLLEYEAYQILEKTLRDAEVEVSQHLVEPIRGIMSVTLPRLTAGRYSNVNLDDSLEVQSVRHDALDINPTDLSTGAKGQLALALRLALVDHLSGKERQTIVLDDALVNFDSERLARAKVLLAEMGTTHQVLYLTCHPSVGEWPEAMIHTLPLKTQREIQGQIGLFGNGHPSAQG